MKSRFGEEAQIQAGSSGQFDVLADGKLIFSKAEVHRFPVEGEVEERFEALKAGKELPPLAAEGSEGGGFLNRLASKLRG